VIASNGATDGLNSIWWQPVVYRQRPALPPINSPVVRFDCNPRIAKPITSESMAKMMPVLLNNCSQFAVEYAGDFITQDNDQYVLQNGVLVQNENWGNATALGPDGVIDYVVDHSKVTSNDYNVGASTRWYGLPRDTAKAPSEINGGPPVIRGYSSAGVSWQRDLKTRTQAYTSEISANELIDVCPLRDVVASIPNPSNGNRPLYPNFNGTDFEREVPPYVPGGDYYSAMIGAPPPARNAFRYTCVWVNSSPKMIRIALKLEDPAGRLPEGQWYEYVVGAP